MDNYWGNSFISTYTTIQNNGPKEPEPGFYLKNLVFTFGSQEQNGSQCEPSKIKSQYLRSR